ncbi:ATP synthase F1 subunit epsilon [Puteibacter caeruleilacunae]|nr:ATP synthase F1 subunit epsilon [Puteibacter caeruleilacunae]
MFLEIVTPEKKIFEGEITLIQLPGSKGTFAILDHHAPIVSTLAAGKIRIVDTSNRTRYFDVNGGIVECKRNSIVVLAE